MPKIEYVGLPNLSKAEKAGVENDAWRYLGMSRIPDRYGKELNLAVGRGSKCASCEKPGCSEATYHARVLQAEQYRGGLYVPMLTDLSYRFVVIDGLSKLDDLFGPVGIEILGAGNNEVGVIGATPIYVSTAWAKMVSEDALDAIEVFRGNMDNRLKKHTYAKKYKGMTLGEFKASLEMRRKDDVGAGITLAAGDKAIKIAYTEEMQKVAERLVSDAQECTLRETLQNLENYEFYLTGMIRAISLLGEV
jgi:hypothetical protein